MAASWLCYSVVLFTALISGSAVEDLDLGPILKADPTNSEVLESADFALQAYNFHLGNDYIYKITKILSAKKQVFAGTKYILEVELGRTQCKAQQAMSLNACPLLITTGVTEHLLCNFDVLSTPSLERRVLLDSRCKPVK